MLKVCDFSYGFGNVEVLKGLNLELPKGSYLSVIGPNGAGKSTFLKCLPRLHDRGRASGKILVKDRPLSAYRQKELARVISYVPQAGGWIPPFTVAELLRMSRFAHASSTSSLKKADYEAVDRAIELTGLTTLASRRLSTLSGGERQKAFLAAALAQEAELMLLDEPASFLDPRHTAELNALLMRLGQSQELTMITVTHDLNHPFKAGGLALILREGHQLYFGPVAGVLENDILSEAYQHSFVRLSHPVTGSPVLLAE